MVATGYTSWEITRAENYQKIVEVSNGNFQEDVPDIEDDDIVVVDMKTAQKLGDRILGTVKNAAWYEVDSEYNLVTINDQLYRISSLKYGDIFKYQKAKNIGIPGFILVDAKTQKAEYIEFKEAMKYAPSACFEYDLERNLRNQYPTYIFSKSFFEVDDDYNPYWITGATDEAQVGLRGGLLVTKILVTNAVTGDIIEYKVEDLPEWIDHAFSVNYLMNIIQWHYSYKHGFFNLSKTDIYRTSYYYRNDSCKKDDNEYTDFEGYNSIVGSDGHIWFYTGLTPDNNAESNVGFLLMSPRTGEIKYYDIYGSEESSAQLAAEGLVSNLQYSASFPTLKNVDGIETYFMTLKDKAGIVKRYSFCNFKQYIIVVQAETFEQALHDYKVAMGLISDNYESESVAEEVKPETIPEETKEIFEVKGVISKVSQAVNNGCTYYYFKCGDDDTVYVSSIKNSSLQPLELIEGTAVTMKGYYSDEEKTVIVTELKFGIGIGN